ncbi:MAG: hypothetical protein AB7T22_10985 [Calditrichaceae bacterium]
MRNLSVYFIMLLLITSFTGCDDDSNDNLNFEYPTTIGSKWHHQRIMQTINFDSDSLEQIYGFNDTTLIISEITGSAILRDSIETIVLNSDGSRHYYQVKTDGLYMIAYENAGVGALILPKRTLYTNLSFKNQHFSGLEEFSKVLLQQLPLTKLVSDSIIFEEPPALTLKYPLQTGTRWNYRESNFPFKIEKQVTGQTILNLDIGSFECYRIQWYYDFDNDGFIDYDISIEDYISKEGLIKRSISAIDVINMNEDGQQVGLFDFFDTYTLTELFL